MSCDDCGGAVDQNDGSLCLDCFQLRQAMMRSLAENYAPPRGVEPEEPAAVAAVAESTVRPVWIDS